MSNFDKIIIRQRNLLVANVAASLTFVSALLVGVLAIF
jgi:hypothetical protein